MNVLLDTNVVLDAMTGRAPFASDAAAILRHAGDNDFVGYITANATADFFYIFSRQMGRSRAHDGLTFVLSLFSVLPVDERDCHAALDGGIDDYEDALLLRCAAKLSSAVVVTRDEELLRLGSVDIPAGTTIVNPATFLGMLTAGNSKNQK